MRKLLSALAVPKLGTGEYWDPLIPGLALRVGARRRTWTLRHRVGGRHRRDILGYFPTVSLADARTAAGKLLERAEAGAAPLPPPVHPRSALTLGALIDRYEALRQREGHRIKQLAPSMRALRVGLADYLSLPAAQFSKADLRAARDAIADRGTQIAANRLLGYLGPVFKWAAQEDLIPTNFVRDLRRAPERKRSHVLSDKEIAAVWYACDRRGRVAGGQSLWAAGALSALHRAAPRRSRLPQAWRHSRWHMEASRQQGRPSPQSEIAAAWHSTSSARARLGTLCSAAPAAASSSASPSSNARLTRRPRFLAGGCTICGDPQRPECRRSASATRSFRRCSIMRFPASGASICGPSLRRKRPRRCALWATELERITRKARAVS